MEGTKEKVVFGGGCFWCIEAVFKMLKGVTDVTSGYAGGHTTNPTYKEVCNGTTGHAEVVQIEYDPAVITYEELLTVFFVSHDGTQLNRQGGDVGTQYRSVVFYTTDEQQQMTENYIKELMALDPESDPIVTEVAPLTAFYPAEDYHQDYFENNPSQAYCQIVIAPKVKKVQEKFDAILASHTK